MIRNITITLAAILFVALLNPVSGQNTYPASGAVGIGTLSPNASSLLDITSTSERGAYPENDQNPKGCNCLPGDGIADLSDQFFTGILLLHRSPMDANGRQRCKHQVV